MMEIQYIKGMGNICCLYFFPFSFLRAYHSMGSLLLECNNEIHLISVQTFSHMHSIKNTYVQII